MPGRSGLLAASVVAWVAGVYSLRVYSEPAREFLDDDIEHQFGQLFLALGTRHQRPPVQHDPGRVVVLAACYRGWLKPRKRHWLRIVWIGLGRRDLLDGELDPGQLGLPPWLKLGDREQHQVIEALGPGPVQRHVRRD